MTAILPTALSPAPPTAAPAAGRRGSRPTGRTGSGRGLSPEDAAALRSCMTAYAESGVAGGPTGSRIAATMALLDQVGGPDDADERFTKMVRRGDAVTGFSSPGRGPRDGRVEPLRSVLREMALRHGRTDVLATHWVLCSAMLREQGRHADVDLPAAAILSLLGLDGPTATALVEVAGRGPDELGAGVRIA